MEGCVLRVLWDNSIPSFSLGRVAGQHLAPIHLTSAMCAVLCRGSEITLNILVFQAWVYILLLSKSKSGKYQLVSQGGTVKGTHNLHSSGIYHAH